MARLIDETEVEKILRVYADDVGCNRGEYELANGILKAVGKLRDVPTAYDVEKVVEEIADLNHFNLNLADKMFDIQKSGTAHRHYVCVEDAIEIIRKGGAK